MEISLVGSLASFAAIGPEWDALAGRFGSALLRHDWFLSCAEALHAERDLRVVTVRAEGRLVAAAPLVLVRDRWVPRLQLLGASILYEPCGLLYDSEAALTVLAQALVAQGRPLLLQRLEAGGPVPAALRAALGPVGAAKVRPTTAAAGIPVREAWAEYASGLPSQVTSTLRRQRARAAAVGPVTTELLAPGPADVDPWLEVVVAIEGSGWKGRQGSALRCRADLLDFFTRYARRAAAAGRLRIAILRIGDDVAAVELAVEDFQRWWQLKIGYADGFRRFYPGLQLTAEVVRRVFERGLVSYEFLGSVAEWESRWRTELRPFEVCVAYPATAHGGAALVHDVCKVGFGRLRRMVRVATDARRFSGRTETQGASPSGDASGSRLVGRVPD